VKVVVHGAPEDLANLQPSEIRICAEWPPEWDVQRPPGESFPPRSVRVTAIAPARFKVTGENNQPLPTVKIYGTLTRPAVGP
jgi:hypothetical protein